MFGLFKKKDDISGMFKDGDWRVLQGDHNGNPIFVRVNNALSNYIGKTDHTLKIGFAIPLNDPNPGGMPTPEENEELASVEDQIINVVRKHGSAVQALAITMGTFKEFVFYAPKNFNVQSAREQLMEKVKSHQVQCMAQIEEDWASYTNWASG